MRALLVGQTVLCPGCGNHLIPDAIGVGQEIATLRCASPHGGYRCQYRGRAFTAVIPTIELALEPE